MNGRTTSNYLKSISLPATGDCSLLAASRELDAVYLELYDSNHEPIEQIGIRLDGEVFVRAHGTSPLEPPPGIVRPRSAWMTMALNFAGARHRGIRAEERIDDLAHPMTVQEKMQISAQLQLNIPPPMILGWIESYSLAEAELARGVYCACRRLRIAYALAQPGRDDEGNPIDYDSAALYIAHLYQPLQPDDLPLVDLMRQFAGAQLRRPMDCMVAGGHLLIADGGDGTHPAQLHLWALPSDDRDERERPK